MKMKFLIGFHLKNGFFRIVIHFCGFEFYCKIPKTVFQNLNTEFPIERTPTTAGSGTQVRKALVPNPGKHPSATDPVESICSLGTRRKRQ